MDLDRVAGGRGKDSLDGAVQFLDHVELFDVALAQLRVAHDLRDDPVGALDFLLDDLDLLGRLRFAFFEGALQGERGVVDDGQRILDLVRELGGEPAGGAQLAFAHRKLAGFLLRAPLPFQQCLHRIATKRHQQQERQAQQQRFSRVIDGFHFQHGAFPRGQVIGNGGIDCPGQQVTSAERQIEGSWDKPRGTLTAPRTISARKSQ